MSNPGRGLNPGRQTGCKRKANKLGNPASASPVRLESPPDPSLITRVASGSPDSQDKFEFCARYCRDRDFQWMVHLHIRRHYDDGNRGKATEIFKAVHGALVSQTHQSYLAPKPAGCQLSAGIPMTPSDVRLVKTFEAIICPDPSVAEQSQFRVEVTTNQAFRTAMLDLCVLHKMSAFGQGQRISAVIQLQLIDCRVPYLEEVVVARWRQRFPLFENHFPELVGWITDLG